VREASTSVKQEREILSYHGLRIPRQRIAEFCDRWKIRELSIFGSILRDDFRQDSDVDILVSFLTDANWKPDDLMEMKEELEALFKHPVDLVEKRLVEGSTNYIRRRHILTHKETLYVA